VNRVDNYLRDARVKRALRWIPAGSRVLDVGCFDGRLFDRLGSRLAFGVGVDTAIEEPVRADRYELIAGAFPLVRPDDGPFDVVTFLAVLEHVPSGEIDRWAQMCRALLVPGGRVVATVPSPAVDRILDVAIRLRIMDGMEADQHHGVAPDDIVGAFRRAGFEVITTQRFQVGLNNLFVLQSPKVSDDIRLEEPASS
jgi:SAM-dependent methyltransferase